MINPGTILQDRYLIEKRIGEGGMGAVYLAIDQRFDNFVAIKETFYSDEEFGEAFEREARILNGLLHPVLPHVSDYFTEGDEHFLVMQFIEGEDASDILKRDGAFPVRDVLRWTDNLLDALDYLHSQEPPIIHRDLKPANLKITPRGDIFLLDFGLAKLKNENTLSERSVFGYSRKYSPLEQIQGTGTDARSDIFALAATVYHLMTGKPPVDVIARASAIVAGKPDPIQPASEINEEVSESVSSILNSALALNAENRFESANAMRQALKYAVQASVTDNAEVVPEALPAAVPAEPKIIDAAENANFPALEAFAAAPTESIESVVPLNEKEPPVLKIPIQSPSASSDKLPGEIFNDRSINVEPRAKQTRLPMAALAALLVIVATVSAFFIFRNRQPTEPNQSPSEVSVSETKPDSKGTKDVSKATQKSTDAETAETESSDKDKPKSAPVKKTAEQAETEDEPVVEDAVSEIPHTKAAKSENKRTARKSDTSRVEENESESEPVPDIESIFTGRPSWERSEKARRRQERREREEGMTEEELREIRRQRRQQRRQNNYPIPY